MYELCDFYINGKKLTKAQFLNYAKELDAKELGNVIGDIPTFKQVPKAPFVTDTNSWVKLGIKTALREAIKQGVDRIAWTTGEQQNERYDLSKQVDALRWIHEKDGSWSLMADKNGRKEFEKNVPDKELEDYVGKDMSQKMRTETPNAGIGEFRGEQLKIGGKGMIGFYGSPQESKLGIVGNIAKSLFKQEPKTTNINIGDDELAMREEMRRQESVNQFENIPVESIGKIKSQQHSIDITPALKQEVEKGLPLFQFSEQAMYDYYEARDELEMGMGFDALKYKKGDKQKWSQIPKARLIKLWNDFAKTGVVRDEKGIEELYDIVKENIIKLDINTAFMGHDTYDAIREFQERYELTDKQAEKLRKVFGDTDFAEDENGQPILSDYGLPDLRRILNQLLQSKTAEEKLLLIDQALNVVHPRSDLAKLFVEGGSKTLSELAERQLMQINNPKSKRLADKIKPKGSVEFLEDGRAVIRALSNPDFSTMVHEIIHVFEKDLSGDEIAIIEKWSGKKQGTREFSEAFARGGERYLRDGKAPNEQLKAIFEKFKAWLTDIYKSLKGSPLEKKLSPEVRKVFDRLLTEVQPAQSPKITLPSGENIQQEGKTPPSGIEVPPTPPKVEKGAETPIGEGETRKRTIGLREVNSTMLRQPVKDAILKAGIDYVPRGERMLEEEAQSFFDLYLGQEGGLDKIAGMVYNTQNGIPGDTRTYLNAYLADHYNTLYNKSTVEAEKKEFLRKATEAYLFGAEQGTLTGQKTNAQKVWGKVLGKNPTMVAAIMQEHVNRKNKGFFETYEQEIEAGRKVLDDMLGTEEGKAKIEEAVTEAFDKIGTDRFGKEDMKKVDDFFNSLKLSENQFYGGVLGIYAAAHNGAIEVIKRSIKAGMSLANAIQDGAAYIEKWYQEQFKQGKIDSPKWDKNGWISKFTEQSSEIQKKVPKVKGEKPAKVKKVKPKVVKTHAEIVDKLLGKMAKFATRKQLSNFMRDYILEHTQMGLVTEERYKALLAKALGMDFVSDKQLSEITTQANIIGHAHDAELDYLDALDKYAKELESNPKSENLVKLKAETDRTGKDFNKAYYKAQKATAKIAEKFQGENHFMDTFTTLVKGGLLVPTSAIKNIYGMVFMAPFDMTRKLIANTIDLSFSAVGKTTYDWVSKINPEKRPTFYRMMSKYWPAPERSMSLTEQTKGFVKSLPKGVGQGLSQLVTGVLPTELSKYDVNRSLDPIKAAIRFKDRLIGEERRKLSLILSDLFEALPGGYISEANFRLLNLGDRSVKYPTEKASLTEQFWLREEQFKWDTKGRANRGEITKKEAEALMKQREKSYDIRLKKFMDVPDSEAKEVAEKAGEKAVYMNENLVTNILRYVDSLAKKGEGADKIGVRNASHVGRVALKLANALIYPFSKAPTNLLSEAFEYGLPPFSLGAAIFHAQNGNRRQAIDYFAKAAVGSVIGYGIVTLLEKGILTPGPGDDDKTKQAEYTTTGRGGDRLNIDAFLRFMTGGDPTWQDGDLTVTTQGYGTISIIEKAYGSIWRDRMEEQNFNMVNALGSMTGAVIGAGFEQTFMQGMNTWLQAALGGEAEKQRWFTNTVTTMTVPLYPNLLANVSKAYADDNQFKETKDISKKEGQIRATLGNTFKDRLFMGKDLPSKVTIWGDIVERVPDGKSPLYYLMGVSKSQRYNTHTFGVKMYETYLKELEKDPENAKNIFPSLPTGRTVVGWDKARMSPQDLMEYQLKVGKIRSIYAEQYINSEEWETEPLEDRINTLTRKYQDATKLVQAEMFDWSEVKDVSEEDKKFLADNDAMPVKKTSKRNQYVTLEDIDVREFNENALKVYSQEAIAYIKSLSTEQLKTEKEIDAETGESNYMEELNKIWSSAVDEAKDVTVSKLETEGKTKRK